MSTTFSEFTTGIRLFLQGFRIMARHKRLWLLGMVPALIAMLLIGTVVVLAALWVHDLVTWATPFADEWSADNQRMLRIAASVVVMVAVVALSVLTFSALTLLIGGPFYEYIAEKVEDSLGKTPPDYDASWLKTFLRGLADSALLLAVSVCCTLPLFCLGFVPLLGQTVIPALSVSVGGWILALELVGVPFARRGMRVGDRHRALRTRPALTLGFGIPVYLVCAIPMLAILVMPVAAAGGTLLAHEVLPRRATELVGQPV